MIARRLLALLLFAVSMGLVEAAAVIYLRQRVPMGAPFRPDEVLLGDLSVLAFLSKDVMVAAPNLKGVEQVREVATIVMLAAVANIAGDGRREKALAFIYCFAIWDLFYYIFLSVLVGWPASVFDQDVFFLLPIPWAGPVLTPIAASILAIFWSAYLLSSEH